MTISSTTVRNSYSGDSSTTTFSYTFKIFADSDIQVIIRSSTGTETTKTITTHYTVTGAGVSAGGTVIFTGGNIPVTGETVILRRNIPQTQAIDYIANDPFPAESHEEGLDRATMAIQQIQEEVTRSIKLSKTNTMTSTEFTVGAAARANKILAFDTNGEISVTQELGTFRGNWATATSYAGRDLVKDTSTNNIFIVNTAHTSSGSQPLTTNANSALYELIVDAASASTSANTAANHASNSSNFANNSSNSANTSANHSANSSNFANNSSNSASNAANSEASVSANANAAANSAANSSNFANNSSNSANSASNHSSNSSNFANNSSNSANTSANHASNSSNFANNSSNSANTSANHSANSSNFANNSSNSANTSANHASNSSNHASNSSNHSANSSNFANTSSNHASNSSNFANNSSNHASNASNAANAANSARDAALVAADNFDDVYLGSKATDPTLDNDGDALTAGDLYYNSTAGNLKYYTGSAWIAVTSGGITDLVQDTSPQLGGALDVNTFSITSTSNGNITLQPNGTGDVVLSADTVKIGDSNTDAILTTDGTGDITISTNSGTNSGTVKIFDGVNGNIEITPNGSGVVKLDGLSYPTADGTANQILKTDGSGVLSFATPSAGFSGATENAIGSSAITLTSASTQFQRVQISSQANSYVTLPDATTLTTEGNPIFVIENFSPISSGVDIKNNGGTIIGTIPIANTVFITLVDNSTSNGTWVINTSADQVVADISSTVNSSTATGANLTKVLHLTATKLLVANFAYSGTTLTLYTKIGDLSGNTITFGSEQSTTIVAEANIDYYTWRADVVRLSDSAFILMWGATGNTGSFSAKRRVSVNTVSGTTITFGTQNALSFATGSSDINQSVATAVNGMCCRMADDKFAVVYNTTTVSSATSYKTAYSGSLGCNIVTVSGTTLTVGTKVDLGSSTFTNPTTLVCHDTDRLCVVYYQATSASNGTGRTKVNIISVSGTTPTWGTSVNVEAADIATVGNILADRWDIWSGTTSLNNMYGVALSTTSVVGIGGGNGGGATGYILISISGTTPTITATKNLVTTAFDYGGTLMLNPPLHINSTTLYQQGYASTNGYYINITSSGFRRTDNLSYTANSPARVPYFLFSVATRSTGASTAFTTYGGSIYGGGTPYYISTGTFSV